MAVRTPKAWFGPGLMKFLKDLAANNDRSWFDEHKARYEAGKDVHAPGYYLHIEPSGCFLGAGMWHPESSALKGVRDAIAADPAAWKKVRDAKAFRRLWELAGDSLKRPPRGYDPEHPMIEDLKRKDHIAVADLDAKLLTSPDLPKVLTDHFRAAKPYMAFQAAALDLPI